MNWERKALEEIILLLVQKDAEYGEWTNKLRHLGVEVDKDSTSYEVLKAITEDDEWIYFLEDLEYVQQGHEDYSKEEFVDMCLKAIQKKMTNVEKV